MTNFPTLLNFSTNEIRTLLYWPESWKRYPFRAEPPSLGHYREYPIPWASNPIMRGIHRVFWLLYFAFRALIYGAKPWKPVQERRFWHLTWWFLKVTTMSSLRLATLGQLSETSHIKSERFTTLSKKTSGICASFKPKNAFNYLYHKRRHFSS